jgi:hypothetical protein
MTFVMGGDCMKSKSKETILVYLSLLLIPNIFGIFEFSADFDLTNGQSLQGASNLALFLHFQFCVSFLVFQFHPVYPRTLKLIYGHTYTDYMPYSST